MSQGATDSEAEPNIVLELGDRLDDAAKVMGGEADELAARRPHPDAHLYDIEEGLRHHAAEVDEFLQEHYYR